MNRTAGGASQYLWVAAWWGVAAGLGEVCALIIEKVVFHKFIYLSLEAGWMAPAMDAFYFMIPGALLWLVARSRRSPLASWHLGGECAFLFFFSIILMYSRMNRWAATLLAIGLAVQTSRMIAAHEATFFTFVRRTTPAFLLMIVGLFVAPRILRVVAERRGSTSRATNAQLPNVLLIILDTVRADELSLYGYPRLTSPALTHWAASGVRFNRAFSTAPWTLPSHASFFTGRFPHELGADWLTPLNDHWPTIAEALRDRGYRTGGFAANLAFCTWESGLTRGFQHFDEAQISLGQMFKSTSLGRAVTASIWFDRLVGGHQRLGRIDAKVITNEFLDWEQHDRTRPFFAFLNYFEAHAPYLPPKGFSGRFGLETPRPNVHLGPQAQWTAAEVAPQRNAYDASIAYQDEELGRLLSRLKANGTLANTLVIIASDHGEEFAEHGVMSHGNSVYRATTQVPLIIWFPNHVPADTTVDAPVSLRDIPATITELIGLDAPFPGRSLARFWNGSGISASTDTLLAEVSLAPNLPNRYPVSHGPIQAIILGDRRYIKSKGNKEELFNFETDLGEQHNLAGVEAARLPEYRRALERMLGSARSDR